MLYQNWTRPRENAIGVRSNLGETPGKILADATPRIRTTIALWRA